MDRSPDEEPAAVCISCRYEFPLSGSARSGGGGRRGPLIVAVFLAAGLGIGILLAVLSNSANVGGWILILLGVGLVAGMGALEAGFLDGMLGRGRGRRPPSPPPPEI